MKNSDEIIVLKGGNIIEQGKHEQLIKNNGLYKEFYDQQSTKTESSILA